MKEKHKECHHCGTAKVYLTENDIPYSYSLDDNNNTILVCKECADYRKNVAASKYIGEALYEYVDNYI